MAIVLDNNVYVQCFLIKECFPALVYKKTIKYKYV